MNTSMKYSPEPRLTPDSRVAVSRPEKAGAADSVGSGEFEGFESWAFFSLDSEFWFLFWVIRVWRVWIRIKSRVLDSIMVSFGPIERCLRWSFRESRSFF